MAMTALKRIDQANQVWASAGVTFAYGSLRTLLNAGLTSSAFLIRFDLSSFRCGRQRFQHFRVKTASQ